MRTTGTRESSTSPGVGPGEPALLGLGDCAALIVALVLLLVSTLWPRRHVRS